MDSEFSNLNTISDGGAIFLSGDTFVFRNCSFINNQAMTGGAILINNVTKVTFIRNVFDGNKADISGNYDIDILQDQYKFRGGAIHIKCFSNDRYCDECINC